MIRYIRAFFKALALTLRGEKVAPVSRYPELSAWIARASALAEAALNTADAKGMDKAARQAATLRVEGRSMSMETILQAAKYHINDEYPYLLRNELVQHSLTAIYATNMNDQFLLRRLQEHLQEQGIGVEIVKSLDTLAAHLESIPSVEDIDT